MPSAPPDTRVAARDASPGGEMGDDSQDLQHLRSDDRLILAGAGGDAAPSTVPPETFTLLAVRDAMACAWCGLDIRARPCRREASLVGAPARRGPRRASRRRFGGLQAMLALVGSLLLLPSGPAQAETRLGDPIPTGLAPLVLAANPATNRVYAGNLAENSLTVIDGITNTAANVK